MSAPIYSNIIDQLFSLLDKDLNSYVYNGYATLADHLKYPLGIAVVLYFMILGISISQGWIKLSISVFLHAVFKIGLIYMFAMNWENFSFYVVHGIQDSANQIGEWIVKASPVTIPTVDKSGVNGALQTVITEITRIGVWVWDRATFSYWSPYFAACLIFLFGYAALVLAVIEIMIAKMMLAVLFSLAPLFISFTLFKSTEGIFDRWIGSICEFCLFLLMIPAVVVLGLSFIQFVIHDQYVTHSGTVSVVDWVPLMIAGVLSFVLILKIAEYAKSIGGTISTSSGSSMLAGRVGGFIGSSAPINPKAISKAIPGFSAINSIRSKFRGT